MKMGAKVGRRRKVDHSDPQRWSAYGISPEDAHASLAPEEKMALVQKLDRQDTLYLGDGANDSLAFNAAWVTGTPVVDRSILDEKADFHFVGQGMAFLPQLLDLAQRRRQVIRVAFSFALLYNISAAWICLHGYMSPLLAAVLMPLSSVVSLAIVGFGLRDRGAHKGEVVRGPEFNYDGTSGLLPAAVEHDPRLEQLRPRTL